jgi:hypothetical protein
MRRTGKTLACGNRIDNAGFSGIGAADKRDFSTAIGRQLSERGRAQTKAQVVKGVVHGLWRKLTRKHTVGI